MPKRIVDGEGTWHSDKIAQVQPQEFRAEFAWMLPLASANGTFECNSRCVWATSYSYNRPDITPEKVGSILDEFARVRLLFRWNAPDGKEWGYWTGIDKPGRLPPPSRLKERHQRLGPEPPKELLRQFLTGQVVDGKPMATHEVANGSAGFGFGSGLGFGFGSGLGKTSSSNSKNEFDRPVFDQPVLGEQFKTADLEHSLEIVWDRFMTVIGKNPKTYTFTSKRKAMGLARLRDLKKRCGSWESAIELATLCVERLHASPWHNGKNPTGQKYLSWEILFRSTEQMESWLDDERWARNTKGAA
jgi:hypothetical protein